MMKTIEQFYAEVKDNKELQQAFQAAVEGGTAEAFLKEQQVDATLEELEAYGKTRIDELSDDELDHVAGGEISWGSYGDKYDEKDVTFEFNIGDRVETYNGWLFGTYTRRGTIINREVRPDRSFLDVSHYYKPKYQVLLDNNEGTEWFDQNYLSY